MSTTGTGLESRLAATLRAKADQVVPDDVAFAPDAVRLSLGRRRPHTGWLVAAAAFLVVAVTIGVVAALGGSSDPERARPAGAPVLGEPVARVSIAALPNLVYEPRELTTVAGVNEIELLDRGGTHTLVFDDPDLSYFHLEVPSGPSRGKVELQAGRDYKFGCVIPGHRSAGMEGVIHVPEEVTPG
jgi:hypothetical protein